MAGGKQGSHTGAAVNCRVMGGSGLRPRRVTEGQTTGRAKEKHLGGSQSPFTSDIGGVKEEKCRALSRSPTSNL